eukprot:UC1_evm2s1021
MDTVSPEDPHAAILQVKAQLEEALEVDRESTGAGIAEMTDGLTRLDAFEMNLSIMRATAISAVVRDVRKQADLTDKQVAQQAKRLIKRWRKIITAGMNEMASSSSSSTPTVTSTTTTKLTLKLGGGGVTTHASTSSPSQSQQQHVQQQLPPQPDSFLTGVPCPPNPTHEYTPYTPGRRWAGVDGQLGPNGRWHDWRSPIALGDGLVFLPYINVLPTFPSSAR